MSKGLWYIENIEKIIRDIKDSQMASILECGKVIADALEGNHRIHIFGTGHSHILAEEIFYRAGGLVNVNPILEEGLMLHNGAVKSTQMERLEGYGQILFKENKIEAKDILILASNAGRNCVTIELASMAREKGVFVIVLTSKQHSSSVESRHPSGKLLYQLGDIVLDNGGCIGDASVQMSSLERKVAPTSTVIGAMILNAIVAQAVDNLEQRGIQPEVFSSSNVNGGDLVNQGYIDKYKNIINDL